MYKVKTCFCFFLNALICLSHSLVWRPCAKTKSSCLMRVCVCLTHTERWFCSRWSREGWVTAVNSSYSDSGGGSAFLTAPPVIPVMTRVFDNSSIWQWSHLSVYDGGKSTVMKSNTQRRWMMFLIERAASGTGGRVRPLLQSCSEQMMLVKRSNHWLLSMF